MTCYGCDPPPGEQTAANTKKNSCQICLQSGETTRSGRSLPSDQRSLVHCPPRMLYVTLHGDAVVAWLRAEISVFFGQTSCSLVNNDS